MLWHREWYDRLYGDDPSTDNIFGREDLCERRNALLQAYLRQGGRLSDFVLLKAEHQARAAMDRAIDRALTLPV